MRELLHITSTNWWSEISAVVFAAAFTVLLVWTYLPARRKEFERVQNFPLDND
jgi:cbb3-type cytochrome oxidase subunit 3